MLILPICKHGICFHLFASSLITFTVLCSFLSKGILPLWFIPRYFIFLVAISNGKFFLISLSDISLLVYKNALDFWILTLYPAVSLNSFIRVSSFWADSIGFSMYTMMSSANNDSFVSSSPSWTQGPDYPEALSSLSDFSMSSTILVSNLHICWHTVGYSLCSSEDWLGVSPMYRGKWTLLPPISPPSSLQSHDFFDVVNNINCFLDFEPFLHH